MPVNWKRPSVLLSVSHVALALQHMNFHSGLAVGGSREHLTLGGTGMVVLRSISLVNTPPSGLNAQGQGRHVQQQNILHFAAQNASPEWQRRWPRTHRG